MNQIIINGRAYTPSQLADAPCTDADRAVFDFARQWFSDADSVSVRTSGSTGRPKPMQVSKARMAASALATCRFLGLGPGTTALLCMPVDFIAGKMMVVRAIVGGLNLLTVRPSTHPLAGLAEAPFFVAMTPMQVRSTLECPDERRLLSGVSRLIIGGGPVAPDLELQLRAMPGGVWSTYGMTETLSHVAMRRISGTEASEWYTPLPGVAISLTHSGQLVIDAPHLCPEPLTTTDMAVTDGCGRFRVTGRADNVINTGGIKVQAEEAEACLAATLHAPFCITSRPDAVFGQAVVLIADPSIAEADLRAAIDRLPRYHRPKAIVRAAVPLTATGKTDRCAARQLAIDQTQQSTSDNR